VLLHCSPTQRIIKRGHDHRLVKNQVTMAYLAGNGIDGIEETIAIVDFVTRAQRLDIREGVLRVNIEG